MMEGFIICLISVAAAAFFIHLTDGQLQWQQIQPHPSSPLPPTRRDHAIGYIPQKNTLIMFGGQGNGIIYGDTWVFNFNSSRWKEFKKMLSPPQRYSLVYGVYKDYFYITTGQDDIMTFSDVWRFDIRTETWEEMSPDGSHVPAVYGAAGGVADGGAYLYVSHGFDMDRRYSTTHRYSIEDNLWEEVYSGGHPYSPNYPHARCLHGGVMTAEHNLVIFGGCLSGGGTGGPCPSHDSWLLDGKAGEWTKLPDCLSPKIYPSLALLPDGNDGQVVILYGGMETTSQMLKTYVSLESDVGVLELESNIWSTRKVLGSSYPVKRYSAALTTAQVLGGVVLFGGETMTNGTVNDLWLLRGNGSSVTSLEVSTKCGGPFIVFWNLIVLHTVFMFAGWGILLQAGAFIARYFKWKGPKWFLIHRVLQSTGLFFALAGFICAIVSVRFDHFSFAHGIIGLIIMILGLLQPLNALIRPHKEQNEVISRKRWIWELIHLNTGRLALILALINMVLAYIAMELWTRIKGKGRSEQMELNKI
ncbi:actin-fragmin kinase isoform X2 [Lingula anatina]|uniref:Actin-fragmin kinase isoform X2 n=1 Tax=Lingula anatina TaxID=7574 RepID=A0A1S3IYI5_LINAN|nr:actin-fragmin kinase isoform X2 [Lingula anatina]|eukprot:XP_013403073.1 actin-fragmin kinase isoform X2 [Lingula anatina]